MTHPQVCVPSAMPGGLYAVISERFEESDVYNFLEIAGQAGREQFSLVYMRYSCDGLACVSPLDAIAGRGVRALVVKQMADHLVHLFERAGTQVYVGARGSVLDAAKQYVAGELRNAID